MMETIPDVYIFQVPRDVGQVRVVSEHDHVLRRFGQVDLIKLTAGEKQKQAARPEADQIFSVIQGNVTLELQDDRQESPSAGIQQVISLSAADPVSILIPFGVVCEIECEREALLARVTTHADDVS